LKRLDDNILTVHPKEAASVPRSFHLEPVRVSLRNRVLRLAWNIVQSTLYRCSPTICHGWRCLLLRAFGAKVAQSAHPYPKARVWAPWNLTLGEYSCIADGVDCYCVSPISLGAHATVSQYSYLCAASHDYRRQDLPLIAAAIVIEAEAWVAADVFVGPGVRIGEGAVVGARSTVMSDVEPWSVIAGSPPLQRARREPFTRAAPPK
jgi:putative colanic acid biosynthesis acetyltransferase WcaF